MSDTTLFQSNPDTVALGEAVESRFLTLCEGWARKRGEKLPISKSVHRDLFCWRQMRVRHRQGDNRNTLSELKSMKAMAQWTVTMNCELRGQDDKQVAWAT